jgi:ATP-binding cassette subfamily F protein 3
MLANFGFRGEDVFKSVSVLSGGERARLSIAKMIACGVSVLVLDEPTNHLDIDSREMLENALSEYEGTVICVSHDRYFIKQLATSILEIDKIGFESGYSLSKFGYEDYIKKRTKKSFVPEQRDVGAGKNTFEESKQRKNQLRSAKTKYSAAEKEIAELENKLSELKSCENNSEIVADYQALNKLYEEENLLEEKIEFLYEELERLETIINSYTEE